MESGLSVAEWAYVVSAAFLLVVAAGAASFVIAHLTWRVALLPLADAVRGGRSTREVAAGRYARRMQVVGRLSYLLSAALLALLLSTPPLGSSEAYPPLSVGVQAALVVVAWFAWLVTWMLVHTSYVLGPAYAPLSSRESHGQTSLAPTVKILLSRGLPALLLVEGAAVPIATAQRELLWLVPVAAVAGLLVHTALFPHVIRWIFPCTPIERTRHAALAGRITQWAIRAGVRVKNIEVCEDQGGGSMAAALGFGRPTAFFGDTLLAAMDWRQQDALIAVLLGVVRTRRGTRINKVLYALVEASMLAAFFWLLADMETQWNANVPGLAPWYPVIVAVTVVAATRYAVWRALGGYTFARYTRRADAFGADLTGERIATMVALHSIGVLTGQQARMSGRIAALDRLRQRPGPRAPWAALPVPSSVPFVLRGETLTVSLGEATPPQPVPEGPHALSQAVAAAVEQV